MDVFRVVHPVFAETDSRPCSVATSAQPTRRSGSSENAAVLTLARDFTKLA